MVYLTTAYAPYFAINAVKDEEQSVIVEVDTSKIDRDRLHPDEDFIAQALAHQWGMPLEAVHTKVRRNIGGYRHHALDSLDGLGNVAHKREIPCSAISRYALIDGKLQSSLFWIALDPCISVMNYRFMGNKYRSITSWIFGDRPDFDVDGCENQSLMFQSEEYASDLRSMWENRAGITVVELGNDNRGTKMEVSDV